MMESNARMCTHCNRKLAVETRTRGLRTCSRCGDEVCGNCVDWTAGAGSEIVCSRCSGRDAPSKCGCE